MKTLTAIGYIAAGSMIAVGTLVALDLYFWNKTVSKMTPMPDDFKLTTNN